MPLINRKVYLELNWIENCTLSNDGDTAKFAITDAKLHVPIVTFSTKDSENLEKQLNKGFKRYAYWDSYERKPEKVVEKRKNLYELLNVSFQSVKRSSVIAYVIAAPPDNNTPADDTLGVKSEEKYFLLRGLFQKLQRID